MTPKKIARVRSLLILSSAVAAAASAQQAPPTEGQIGDKVRLAVTRLPYYGVFDLLAFDVKGTVVTLAGKVYQASLKEDAYDAVKKIPGVTQVVNKIQVLPVSMNDDRLRRAVFRAIYSDEFLAKYGTPQTALGMGLGRRYWGRGFNSMPGFGGGGWGRGAFLGMEPIGDYAIHIIIENGKVTLYGKVDNEVDRNKAAMDARGVPGVFGVDNQIQVIEPK